MEQNKVTSYVNSLGQRSQVGLLCKIILRNVTIKD